jgi:hypothetical protein
MKIYLRPSNEEEGFPEIPGIDWQMIDALCLPLVFRDDDGEHVKKPYRLRKNRRRTHETDTK